MVGLGVPGSSCKEQLTYYREFENTLIDLISILLMEELLHHQMYKTQYIVEINCPLYKWFSGFIPLTLKVSVEKRSELASEAS